MKLASLVLFVCTLTACQSAAPVRTAHGWKTKHVEAVRYKNDLMGYNIGFMFPLNPDDCDRAEIVTYVESHGGRIYDMGGYSGAPVWARCADHPTGIFHLYPGGRTEFFPDRARRSSQ